MGMQKLFAQILSCFSQIIYKEKVLIQIAQTKTHHCKQIKVSTYLVTNYRCSKS